MKKIISFIILVFFSVYWGATFFFTAPNNYLKIKEQEGGRIFKNFFYQAWGFFAPPPTSNDRLYCIIHKKSDSTKVKVLELIKPIIDQKISKTPFNNKADLLDYILSNNFIGISNKMRNTYEYIEYKDKECAFSEKEKDSILNESVERSPQLKALKKYAKEIAKKNGFKLDEYLLSLRLTYLPMPKFVDRYKTKEENNELLVFQSRLF